MSDALTVDSQENAMESESLGLFLVRFGFQCDIVPIHAAMVPLQRGDAVVCRTHRGIEMGEVLTATEPAYVSDVQVGKFIRRSRPDDQLLWRQLKALSIEASEACQAYLKDRETPDVLIEVEPLIDGKTLYFHFLGDPTAETEQRVQELADIYQKKVAASRFAELLEHGCGPGCGTQEKSGCGTGGGCAVCSIAGKCTAK
jgi:cell fate regulator YaaT (PSP1 superfamily)